MWGVTARAKPPCFCCCFCLQTLTTSQWCCRSRRLITATFVDFPTKSAWGEGVTEGSFDGLDFVALGFLWAHCSKHSRGHARLVIPQSVTVTRTMPMIK